MEFEYEDRMEMIRVIDSYLDIANYEHSKRNYVLNKSGLVIPNVTVNKDWHEIHALINEELREKGYFSDKHTLFIHFDPYTGKIESIYIELEIPHETEETHDEYDVDDCEIKITKKDSFVISKRTELRFNFSPSEWKNFKRTELMDRMLNEKVF